MSRENSGFIGVDKRSAKAGVYGMEKHLLERIGGNFKAVIHTFPNEYSIDFDGSDDKMDTNMVAPADPTYSYSAWVKTTDTTGTVIGDINSGGSNATTRGAIAWYNSKWYFTMGNNSAGNYNNTTYSASSVLDGNWHFVVLTIDGADQKFYVDGSLNASHTLSISAGTLGTQNIFVGSWGGFYYYLDGKVDEVARFGYALSLSEVQALYNSGTPTDLNSLEVDKKPTNWWRMGDSDGGTGTTITDAGSSPSDGDLENGPTFSSDVPT